MSHPNSTPNHILLVDDEPHVLSSLKRTLAPLRAIIDTAPNAEEGLQLVHQKTYDLIISDQRMPGVEGTEFLARVQEVHPDVARMVLSGYADFDSITQAFNQGVVHYFISKPWQPAELCHIVKKLLNMPKEGEDPGFLSVEGMAAGVDDFHGLVTASPKMRQVFERLRRAALANVPVFIYGETGTGKELAAKALHLESSRLNETFVPFNCAVFTDTLMESQLFGHKKGAFTGAVADTRGLLHECGSGTLFLDETTTLPLALQAKLLRVLQERTYSPVGSYEQHQFKAQVITASSTRLSDAVIAGDFREDLRYRFEVIPIDLPPLRERDGDSLLLFSRFLQAQAPQAQWHISDAAKALILQYRWPGNVRQCLNAAHYAAAMTTSNIITVESLPDYCREDSSPRVSSSGAATDESSSNPVMNKPVKLDREQLQSALLVHGYNKSETARALGVSRMTLWRRMKEWHIEDMSES